MVELELIDRNGCVRTARVASRGSLADALRALGYALAFDCGGRGVCGRCRALVDVGDGEFRSVKTCQTPLTDSRGCLRVDVSCLSRLSCFERDAFAEVGGACACAELTPTSEELRGEFGVAVDLGSTTIVCALVSLATSRVLQVGAVRNPQVAYGRDVLSRIGRASADGSVAGRLGALASRAIGAVASSHLRALGVGDSQVTELVVAGNTTMEYFFSGSDVSPLGVAPFTAPIRVFPERAGSEFDWGELNASRARVRVFPVFSSFVGGDVLSGLSRLIACGVFDLSSSSLLLDVGTNGEAVLASRGRLYATSTAAGPAFEGSEISQGSLAEPGAICAIDCDVSSFAWRARTLGGAPSRGVCGSGLVDALAAMLDFGALDASGRLTRALASPLGARLTTHGKTRRFLISNPDENPVWLTQRDIRNAQLAIAAMKAGRRILCEVGGVDACAEVFLAGGFGASLDRSSAIRVGLLPSTGLARYVGNSSLWGAVDALVGRVAWSSLPELASRVKIVDLTAHNFTEIFTDSMRFPEG